jgi:tRNA-uridine 2-sulfurtransferase
MRLPSNTDNEHYVVVRKDIAANRLVVTFDKPGADGLFQTSMLVTSLNWFDSADAIAEKRHIEVRPRYRDPRVGAWFEPQEGGVARVTFDVPQRAIAPGQICAFHEGEWMTGGGIFVG